VEVVVLIRLSKTELKFVEQMGRSPSKRGRHEPMFRKGPHLSTLKYNSLHHISNFTSSSPPSPPLSTIAHQATLPSIDFYPFQQPNLSKFILMFLSSSLNASVLLFF